MNHEGKYIYCIMASDEAKHFGPIGIGGRGDDVHNICYKGLSAVVSNTSLTKYEVSPDVLLAHQRVVEKVMKTDTILPVRFCTVAESVNDILRLLEQRRGEFFGLLWDLEDKAEFGVKVYWKDMQAVFAKLAAENPDLNKKGQSYRHMQKGKRIQMGREVAARLAQKKENECDGWITPLSRISHRYQQLKIIDDRMVINAVFLVDKSRQHHFDETIEYLSRKDQNGWEVKYVGPIPPYNFVSLELHVGRGGQD